jgi:hypothetical protein
MGRGMLGQIVEDDQGAARAQALAQLVLKQFVQDSGRADLKIGRYGISAPNRSFRLDPNLFDNRIPTDFEVCR